VTSRSSTTGTARSRNDPAGTDPDYPDHRQPMNRHVRTLITLGLVAIVASTTANCATRANSD
jgi:hypothetical protein